MSQIAVNTLRKHSGGYSRKRTVKVPSVTLLCCKRMRNIITPRGVIGDALKFGEERGQ